MVEKMALAWPELRQLDIQGIGVEKPTSRVLIHLANHCPKLAMLTFNIDLRRLAKSNWKSIWDGKKHLAQGYFDPGMTSIDAADIAPFAELLRSVFVGLHRLQGASDAAWPWEYIHKDEDGSRT